MSVVHADAGPATPGEVHRARGRGRASAAVMTAPPPRSPTRRHVLLGSLAMAGAACRAGSAPAIMKGEIDPREFGATGGDPEADTRAWNLAVAAAAERGRPILARGTYIIRMATEPSWDYQNRPGNPVYVAVRMRSGVSVYGRDAEFLQAPLLVPPPPETLERKQRRGPKPARARYIMFGTGLNPKAGSLRDIHFEGLRFDFRDEIGPVGDGAFAFGMTGVENLRRHDIVIRSTGARAGRGLHGENLTGRVDTSIRHENIQQGIHTLYERGVSMTDISFDGFNEALDFNGPCWNVTLKRLRFRNAAREGQCVDTGGGARWLIDGVDAQDTGAVVYVYAKPLAWRTYGEWLAAQGAPTSDWVPPSDMTVRNVVASGINVAPGSRQHESARIGSLRNKQWRRANPDGGPSPRNITFERWTMRNCAPIFVGDCDGFALRDLTIADAAAPRRAHLDGAISVWRRRKVPAAPWRGRSAAFGSPRRPVGP